MGKNQTSFQPGQVANPHGRPKKDRALTAMLETAGARVVDTDDGRMSLKRIAIANVWAGLTQGRIEFASGDTLKLFSKDYVELVKFLFTHIDGPAKQQVEHTGEDGGPIRFSLDIARASSSDDDPALDVPAARALPAPGGGAVQ